MSNGQQPAYPIVPNEKEMTPGLSKREYFAGLAMQAMISMWYERGDPHEGRVVDAAVKYADALLAELEKTQP